MPVPRLSNTISRENDGQPAQEVGQPRFLPGHLHMRDEARHQDQVGGPVTDNLIGDADPHRSSRTASPAAPLCAPAAIRPSPRPHNCRAGNAPRHSRIISDRGSRREER